MIKKIIKYFLLLLAVSFTIFLIGEVLSNTPVSILKKIVKKGGLDSKAITLSLNFLSVIPVGEAKIENLGKENFRNKELIHIKAQAKTFNYFKSIFSAKAAVDSYIEPSQIHSVYFLQHLEILNKPDEDREISYDQQKHIMTYKGKRGIEQRVIDEHAQDPLSSIYYIQNKEFNIGEQFSLSLNTNQKNYVLQGKFIRKEFIAVGSKNYEIEVVDAHVGRKDKSERHQTRFKIWFLVSDSKRIPILIKAMTNVGPIVAKAK